MTQNHFLAVGEDSQIKFWDMDNINILTITEAEGGLSILPFLRFNKEGNLLAVTTIDNGIKILASAAGIRSLRSVEGPAFEALKPAIEPAAIKVMLKQGDGSYACIAESATRFTLGETISGTVKDASKLPKWNYDGSSTGQAPGKDSEVIIYPQAIFKDPFMRGNNILVRY